MNEVIDNYTLVRGLLESASPEEKRAFREAIKAEFPKHSPAAFSLASRPEETGVEFCKRALDIIIHTFAVEGKHTKKERRTKEHRFGCRLTSELAKAVRTKMKREGIQSVQTLLETLLKGWVTA